MNEWLSPPVLITLACLIVGVAVFVVGALLWLRRLRQNLSAAVAEALNRQINHGAKVEEALVALQKNQKQMQAHVTALAQNQNRVRQDMLLLSMRFERRENAAESQDPGARLVH